MKFRMYGGYACGLGYERTLPPIFAFVLYLHLCFVASLPSSLSFETATIIATKLLFLREASFNRTSHKLGQYSEQ